MQGVSWICQGCGSRDVRVTREPWLTEARHWLTNGGRWRREDGVCRDCGQPVNPGTWFGFSAPQPEWLRLVKMPVQLVNVVRHSRWVTPTPISYLVPVALVTPIGVVVQWLWGWPWWTVPVLAMAGLWLAYLSTAFGRASEVRPLRRELLDVIAPGGSLERHRAEEAERFLAAPFPLYGLPPSWPGVRYLAGWSQAGGSKRLVRQSMRLGHGEAWREQGPRLVVKVGNCPDGPFEVRHNLVERMWMEAQLPTDDIHRLMAAARKRPDPDWSQVLIPVDGEPQAFDYASEGQSWVARANVGGCTITLEGREFPMDSVELARIDDVEPYIEGQRQVDAARHRSASS